MSSLRITRPERADCSEIERLFSVTVRQEFQLEGSLDSHESDAEREVEDLCSALNRCFDSGGSPEYFLIARVDSRVVGTIARGPANKIIRDNLDVDFKSVPEIKCVYVLPEFQGTGIGTRLFREILIHLSNENTERFCLDSGYSRARAFWTRRLGDPAVVLPDYWGKHADHMIWTGFVNDYLT